MFDTLTELFLNNYFLFNVVAGKIIGDGETLFDKLYAVFLLPETKRSALYSLTQREEVREMKTYGDYAQICRIQKFSELSECRSPVPDDLQEIIAVKGGALRKAKQFRYDELPEATRTAVGKFISDSADTGLISSLCMLGFLQCEGILVGKNERLGRKNLGKAAQWNSIEGILYSLFYDEANRKVNLDRLFTVTQGTLYEDVFRTASEAYGITSARALPENKLLKKAFGAGILKPMIYSPQYSRFIFSEILDIKDKERALCSGHKEAISETADLPLKLVFGDIAFRREEVTALPLQREKENDRICRCAANADMRRDAAYRPLCVSADSEYLLKLYISSMKKAFPSAHIEEIDVADLHDYDFEPTRNNVFLRSCDEDAQNVFILYFKGAIREGVMNAVKNFLQSDKRKNFRLLHPCADIDLGSVLPICFCDRQNAKLLKPYCDVISLAPVNAAEKPGLLAYIFRTKAAEYAMKEVCAESEAEKLLAGYTVDRAENLIDRAVRFNRGAETLTITADMLKELANGDLGTRTRYGFGGAGNENK